MEGTHCAQQLPGVSYKHIGPVLQEHIPSDGILCSDSAPAYQKFARNSGVRLEQMNVRKGDRVKDKNFHIQNANSLHYRFKTFMKDWKGPATKNLQKYAGWMIFRDIHKADKKARFEMLRYILDPS